MGQRLVVTITGGENHEPKMKIYYHWSAYTASTFEVLNDLWNVIKPLKKAGKSTEEILLGIIRHLEGNVDEEHLKWLQKMYPDGSVKRSCHGGIGWFNKEDKLGLDDNRPNEELAYIQSLYPGETFSTDVDRNDGLVYMSKDGMDDVQSWSEGNASIDLDTETFSNDIHWPYDGKEDYIERLCDDRYNGSDEETVDELAKEYDSLPTYDGDGIKLFEGKCDDIETNMNVIFDLVGNGGYQFKDEKGTVWEMVA